MARCLDGCELNQETPRKPRIAGCLICFGTTVAAGTQGTTMGGTRRTCAPLPNIALSLDCSSTWFGRRNEHARKLALSAGTNSRSTNTAAVVSPTEVVSSRRGPSNVVTYRAQTMLPAKASTRRAQDILISTCSAPLATPGVFRAGRLSSTDGQRIWLMKVKRVETPPLSTTGSQGSVCCGTECVRALNESAALICRQSRERNSLTRPSLRSSSRRSAL